MVDCIYEDLKCLQISSPLLESLSIVFSMKRRRSGLDNCQLKIFAPQLTFFEYRAPLTQLHAVKPLSSVVDVEVELYGGIDKFDGQAMCTIPSSPMHSSFPFHSLKDLKVSADLLNDKIICTILRLLVANPCLGVFSLEIYGTPVESPYGYSEEYLKIFKVYSEQISGILEEVEITCPDLSDPVLHLVKMLLGKEAFLKRLLLSSHSASSGSQQRPNKRKRLLQKVLSFPRRSCNLVVAFL
ncbi:hypothetical protein Taro_040788 [Colocasia esculenta]|uniref:FBD domain-containing protein n=1 Tax=Colocasia esculenta TaxID=4460 RepID=A0A843WZ53_COLES|nr:hypothetical protein [Colocasia esculenta]